MVDQNQTGSQVNNQPVMGGNPYDLVDNKTPENNVQQAPVQNVEPQVAQPVQQAPVENTNNLQVDVNAPQVNQPVQNQPVQAKPYKWPSGFTKKLVKFIAKLSGQPDPETWAVKPVPQVTQNVNNVSQNTSDATNAKTENKSPFDSIMWGVTGFLDKVEKKVENAAGIDLDAPVNKPVENKQTPVEQQPVPQAPVEQQSQEEVKQDVPSQEVNTITPDLGAAPNLDQNKPA